MNEPRPNAKLPDPVETDMKLSGYQPGKAEPEEEFDMPGWSRDQVRGTFMRLFVARES